MDKDFNISTWGRHYLVTAQSTRAVAWLADHWRVTGEPPACRSTTVARLLREIIYWWEHYEPTYTYELSPSANEGLHNSDERIM